MPTTTGEIQLRHDTAATWTSINPLLASGELGVETDTGRVKVGDGATTWTALNYFGSRVLSNSQSGTTYTFALVDAGKCVEGSNASAQTYTVPPNSSVAFPLGTVIEVFQLGAGQITIAAGAGVTLRSDGSKVVTAGQYATAGLRKRATDEWVLSGDLA